MKCTRQMTTPSCYFTPSMSNSVTNIPYHSPHCRQPISPPSPPLPTFPLPLPLPLRIPLNLSSPTPSLSYHPLQPTGLPGLNFLHHILDDIVADSAAAQRGRVERQHRIHFPAARNVRGREGEFGGRHTLDT